MKIIGIAGGTGFVGRHLSALLETRGYKVVVFSRGQNRSSDNIQFAQWQPDNKEIDIEALSKVDAIINLAGAGVADKRWTPSYKKEILSSRVDATHFLLDQLRKHAPNCVTYIASSATGIYGPDRAGSTPFTETSPPYNDFLAEVCEQWEAASNMASKDYRTSVFRFGIVLGKDGGAYKELSSPMKFGVMPILGSGKQMVSWVHVEDVAAMLVFALENQKITGTYNCVAPEVISHKTLMKTIAKEKGGLKIPMPVPAFGLNIIMGESSIEVLKSCTTSDEKIRATGFQFQYPNIESAIHNLVVG